MEAELFQFIERKQLKNVTILLADDHRSGIIIADNGPFEPAKLMLKNGFSGQVISSLFLEQVIHDSVKSFSFRSENIFLSCRPVKLPDLSDVDPEKERIQDLLYLLRHSEDDLHREVLAGQVRQEAIKYFSGTVDKHAIDGLRRNKPEVYKSLSGSDPMEFIASTFSSNTAVFAIEVKDEFRYSLKNTNNQLVPEKSASFLANDKLFFVIPDTEDDDFCDIDSYAFLRKELAIFKSWDCLNLIYEYCVDLSVRYRSKNEQMAVVFHHIEILTNRYESQDIAKYMVVMLKGPSFLESQKMHNINLEWKINKRLLDMIRTQPLDFSDVELRFIKFLGAFEQELNSNQHQMIFQDANIIYPSYAFQFINRLFMFFKVNTKEQSRVFSAHFFRDFLLKQL